MLDNLNFAKCCVSLFDLTSLLFCLILISYLSLNKERLGKFIGWLKAEKLYPFIYNRQNYLLAWSCGVFLGLFCSNLYPRHGLISVEKDLKKLIFYQISCATGMFVGYFWIFSVKTYLNLIFTEPVELKLNLSSIMFYFMNCIVSVFEGFSIGFLRISELTIIATISFLIIQLNEITLNVEKSNFEIELKTVFCIFNYIERLARPFGLIIGFCIRSIPLSYTQIFFSLLTAGMFLEFSFHVFYKYISKAIQNNLYKEFWDFGVDIEIPEVFIINDLQKLSLSREYPVDIYQQETYLTKSYATDDSKRIGSYKTLHLMQNSDYSTNDVSASKIKSIKNKQIIIDLVITGITAIIMFALKLYIDYFSMLN